MPFPSSPFVPCKCDRCGFDGQRLAEMPHLCRVFVNMDQYDKDKADAARYRFLRDKASPSDVETWWWSYMGQGVAVPTVTFDRIIDTAMQEQQSGDRSDAK